jgi:hypothetical protein
MREALTISSCDIELKSVYDLSHVDIHLISEKRYLKFDLRSNTNCWLKLCRKKDSSIVNTIKLLFRMQQQASLMLIDFNKSALK